MHRGRTDAAAPERLRHSVLEKAAPARQSRADAASVPRRKSGAWGARLVGAGCLLALAMQAEAGPSVMQADRIVIGVQDTAVPFAYRDRDGQPVGYSIELCLKVVEGIEQRRGRKLEKTFVSVSSGTRLAMLLTGRIDIECGSTSNTAPRRKLGLAFSVTTFVSDVAVLVRRLPQGPRRVGDLASIGSDRPPIVVTRGSTSERHMRELEAQLNAKLHLHYADNHADSFGMLADGRASAFALDRVLLLALAASSSDRDGYALLDGDVAPQAAEHYALMMRADDDALKLAVDTTLQRLMREGEMARIYARWFEQPIPAPDRSKGAAATFTLGLPISPELKRLFQAPSDEPPR